MSVEIVGPDGVVRYRREVPATVAEALANPFYTVRVTRDCCRDYPVPQPCDAGCPRSDAARYHDRGIAEGYPESPASPVLSYLREVRACPGEEARLSHGEAMALLTEIERLHPEPGA